MEILNNYNVNYHMSIMKKYIALSDELIFATPFLSEDIDYLFKELGVEPHLNKITLITVLKSFDESLRKAYILYKFIKFCEENKIIYEVIIDEKLHGKVYMFYKDKKEIGTIISSANLTQKGLINNHEWGVLFQESEKQKEIYDVLIENKVNVKITKEQIYKIKEEADKFRETHKEMEFTVKFDASRFINIKPYKKSLNVKYFIKPIGSSDKPYPDKTIMPTDIYFSRRYPKAVTENDILICYAVGNGRLLGYYLVTSEKALKASEPKENRWPYFIESECLSQLYSNHWWDFELFLTSLEKEFNELYQDKTITSSGGRTLGSLQFGNDKVQITEEFAQFLIDKIYNISK